jgi:hypothetical protein
VGDLKDRHAKACRDSRGTSKEEMMDIHSSKCRRFVLAAFACFAVALLGSASTALAVQSHQYDPFLNPTSCPTESPYLNPPTKKTAICIAGSVGQTAVKFGNFESVVNSLSTVGFAVALSNPAIEPEVCPTSCVRAVPGSTVLDVEPIKISFPLHGRRKPKGDWHGPGLPQPSITASIELAGDAHAFTLAGSPQPFFRLPLKVHLQGKLLGNNCYIGSNANPIDFAAVAITEPQQDFLPDPNGLPVATVTLGGLTMADNTFSVPAAQGCGPALGFGKYKINLLDGVINWALGLPSPAGENGMVLSSLNASLVLGNGGAMLKAAFAAAQLP